MVCINPFCVSVRLAALGIAICLTTSRGLAEQPAGGSESRAASPSLAFETPAHPQAAIVLAGRDAGRQLVVTFRDGTIVRDATREVLYSLTPNTVAQVDENGFMTPLADGLATLTARLSADPSEPGSTEVITQTQVEVVDFGSNQPVNFPNQVVPVFTKFGCNSGGCHGKAAGQAGFKLSLLGFEAEEDYEHLVRESRGRRLFPAAPSQSLLLLKAIGASPHGGGQRIEEDSDEYRLLQRWIAGGMPYGNADDPVVTGIEVLPKSQRLERGQTQQLCVLATYSDGHVEDITRTAQFESNNLDLASVTPHGLVSLGDLPGGVAIMARYQGQVGVFQARIPLGIPIADWPPAKTIVDELVFAQLKTLGVPLSPVCDDATFVRRVSLDLAGRLPTPEEAQAFVAETSPSKDAMLVDRLLASTDHAEYFAKKWSAILRNRRPGAGSQFGSFAFYDWLRSSFHENKPYDVVVREILTASGSIESNPPVAWYREVSDTQSRVEDAAQLFLGQRLQCARCHHHPYEKWSQTDYFQMAAFFSKVSKKPGLTADEPHFVSRIGKAASRHPKTGQQLEPSGLDASPASNAAEADPRVALVDWMVAPENPFFARSLANRYWKHLFAVGLVEPEDDMRVTNPPSNPELLDGLADYFVQSNYDLKSLLRLMCTSHAYRLTSLTNEHNRGDTQSYSRYYPKRLQAEVLLDAVDRLTMTETAFAGMPAGTRAVSLPDTDFPSYFLDVFGKPDASTACECERSGEATLAQSLHLLNSKEVQGKLRSDTGRAAAMASSSEPTETLIRDLYMSAFSRWPSSAELTSATQFISQRADRRREAFEDLVWTLMNTKEFLFNH